MTIVTAPSTCGYICSTCGMYVSSGTIHSCPSIYATTTFPVSGMKQIQWQEYTPARPPLTGGDFLIVYNDMGGSKRCVRGTFHINVSFQHQWKDEQGIFIMQPVTHYAQIELPI